MQKEFYKKLVEIAGFGDSEIIGSMHFTFGEEKDFTNFVEIWTEAYKRACHNGRTIGATRDYQENLSYVFINNLATLDWGKVWLNINEQIYNVDNKFIFEYIMKSISLDMFIEKINNCNDSRLVYNFYMLYGRVNNVSQDEMKQKYITYLDIFLKRIDSTYEIMLNNYFDQLLFENENDLEDIICILLEQSNLDYMVEEDDGIIHSLKDKIAVQLSMLIKSDKVTNEFLALKPAIYFKNGYGNTTDICQLNLEVGNNEEGKRVFNSDDYQLYSLQQYNTLRNRKFYDIKEYGRPIDNLSGIVMSAEKTTLLELLYSDKVKMIGAEYLHVIKNKIGNEEYEKFMKHVNKNSILIYFVYEHEKVVVSDDLNDTLSYLMINKDEKSDMTLYVRHKH